MPKDLGVTLEDRPVKANARVPVYKRVLDLSVILILSPLWVPVMTVIALGIKLVSRGPILFKQERVGFLGAPFTCLKFRSMRFRTETASHQQHFKNLVRDNVPMVKLDVLGDPRLIPLGAILRATGLDELPQLFNVIRGEMSLVGPRPCTPDEYETCFQGTRERKRFEALPGLTGLWQVSGKNDTTFSEMVDLDARYAQNQSLWMDVGIMSRTLPVLLGQTKKVLQARFARL